MDPEALDQRLHVALTFLSRPAQRELLRVLALPDQERVREIGRLYQEGTNPGVAELLMDLEGSPRIRKLAASELRKIIRRED